MKNKCYIKLDEKALKNAEEKHDVTLICKEIDEIYDKAGFSKSIRIADGMEYVTTNDVLSVCSAYWHLAKKEWIRFCSKWEWTRQDETGEVFVCNFLDNFSKINSLRKQTVDKMNYINNLINDSED